MASDHQANLGVFDCCYDVFILFYEMLLVLFHL